MILNTIINNMKLMGGEITTSEAMLKLINLKINNCKIGSSYNYHKICIPSECICEKTSNKTRHCLCDTKTDKKKQKCPCLRGNTKMSLFGRNIGCPANDNIHQYKADVTDENFYEVYELVLQLNNIYIFEYERDKPHSDSNNIQSLIKIMDKYILMFNDNLMGAQEVSNLDNVE